MKVRQNILQTALITMIIVQLLSAVVQVYAPPFPIGAPEYLQTNPFESNPTVGTTSGIVGGVGVIGNAFDGDFATNYNWRIGGAANTITAFANVSSFKNSPSFTIGWVDIKVDYRAEATIDDRYRIVYQVGASAWQELQTWISGAGAAFPAGFTGQHGPRVFSNVTEPNDGVWTWTDVADLKVSVETNRVTTIEDGFPLGKRFYLHEVWLTVYEGSYPAAGPGVSIQPHVISSLVTGNVFFIDVYVTDVVQMHGFQFLITYNTTVLTAFEYFTYTPFLQAAPSEINDTVGYVAVAYSSYFSDPTGFTGSEPVIRIYFIVDLEGASLLHFDMVDPQLNRRVLLSDVFGFYIPPVYINDGVFATTPIHDVAVADVNVNATQLMPGGHVEVNATVANQGTFVETFDLTAYYNSTVIATQTVTSLSLAESRVVTFDWDTTGVSVGHYIIKTVADVVSGETDTNDNTFIDGTVIVGRHDIAVTNVIRAYPTIDVPILPSSVDLNVTQGEKVFINMTVANLGTFTETFDVTAWYRDTENEPQGKRIGSNSSVTLLAGNTLNFSYTWDTTSIKFKAPTYSSVLKRYIYYNYTTAEIRGNVTEIANDVNTANNRVNDGFVNVTRSAPSATFGANPDIVWVGQPVTFDAHGSQPDPKNATTIVKYDWRFGDGNFTSVTTEKIIHAYAAAGSYQVNLTVWNSAGFNGSYVKPQNLTVYIRDLAIVGMESTATTATVGEFVNITVIVRNWSPREEQGANVTLYANDARVPNLNVTVYYGSGFIGNFNAIMMKYNVGGNNTSTNTTRLIFLWNTTGLARGSYIMKAVVTPAPASGTIETFEGNTTNNVYVLGAVSLFNAPTVIFTYAPARPFVTQPVAFDAFGSSDVDGTIASFKWDFGDSNTTTVTSSIVRHAYAAKGKYTVNLTVTDNEGFARSMVQNVTVYIRDLSVFSVEASPMSVTAGDMVSISVTVRNEGESADSFEVVVMGSRDGGPDEDIDFANVTNLAPNSFTTVTFNWDTSGWAAGTYTIKGSADSNYDSDLSDNLGVGNAVNVAAPTNWLLYGAVGAVIAVAVALGLLYFFKFRKK